MWDAIKVAWSGLPKELQGAVIGAGATVVAAMFAATFGAVAVFWQIGRQARSAIRQNQHNEALKLKLEVYKEIVPICRDAISADVGLSSYIQQFKIEVALFGQMTQAGLEWPVPKARLPILLEKKGATDRSLIEIISVTERWQIIDPRIEIFRIAINAAKHDVDAAFQAYFKAAGPITPHEISTGKLRPWNPPDEETGRQFAAAASGIFDALMTLGSYIYDFQIEMQNALVGELFKQKLPARKPIVSGAIVIQLDRHMELAIHFDKNTAWGQDKARVEGNIRAAQLDKP